MSDFKLKYYFNEYKDKVFKSSETFRRDFIKKHGEYEDLSKLVVMIYNYQIKKYGGRLSNGFLLYTREEIKRKKINSQARERYRLGK